jgi:hypothetical protein
LTSRAPCVRWIMRLRHARRTQTLSTIPAPWIGPVGIWFSFSSIYISFLPEQVRVGGFESRRLNEVVAWCLLPRLRDVRECVGKSKHTDSPAVFLATRLWLDAGLMQYWV